MNWVANAERCLSDLLCNPRPKVWDLCLQGVYLIVSIHFAKIENGLKNY
jgi:hypothetical protein